MRKLREGEEFPLDFWNYLVNPITGYYIKKEDENSLKMERKYNKMAQ
jgi:hypothetical protein